MRKLHTSGFTLVELMISIVLGLIITAAAARILVTSTQTNAAQQAGSGLINDEVIGLEGLERSILLSGYGSQADSTGQSRYVTSDTTPFGGVALTGVSASASAINDVNVLVATGVAPNSANSPLTRSGTSVSKSNLATNSDQLTVQSMIPAGTSSVTDCEGNTYNLPAGYNPVTPFSASETASNQPRYLIERYYVDTDSLDIRAGEPSSLSLFCSAGLYFYSDPDPTDSTPGSFVFQNTSAGVQKNFASAGSIVINRVEHFKVLLGVNSSTAPSTEPSGNETRFVTPAQYMDSAVFSAPKPRIVALKVGLVIRSSDSVPQALQETAFSLLGQNLTLSTADNFLREPVEKTYLLRNSRGWRR